MTWIEKLNIVHFTSLSLLLGMEKIEQLTWHITANTENDLWGMYRIVQILLIRMQNLSKNYGEISQKNEEICVILCQIETISYCLARVEETDIHVIPHFAASAEENFVYIKYAFSLRNSVNDSRRKKGYWKGKKSLQRIDNDRRLLDNYYLEFFLKICILE